ncbi:hypothetical protein BKA70DRAFT_1290889 [Coprinopsis sp. MPI-PUGE-AT-0042]|nr:hypothetical protein BKA70DRAFT_1290889 [Coprinopsis sp. MPI-PUGE-AT-0042]
MSYQVLGRAIKNEYLALGTFATTFGAAFLATRGGDKKPAPATPQQAKAAVPINASSKDEEDFIKNFILEADKDGAAAAAH